MSDEDCIFCKIIAGELPSSKVHEDESFIAFMSIAPFNKGHLLVLPRKHRRWVWDLSDDENSAVMKLLSELQEGVKKATGCEYVMLLTMGEEVEHAHFHLIPKFKGDSIVPWPTGTYEEGEMAGFAEKIRAALK